jgi:hypothetical protein
MFDIEVCVLNKVPTAELEHKSLEEKAEALILYDRKLIRINLTGVWDLAFGKYVGFLDELIGIIIHEYLHYFFHVNGIPQTEEMISELSTNLLVLSLGRLIGGNSRKDEDIKDYERWLRRLFRKPKWKMQTKQTKF